MIEYINFSYDFVKIEEEQMKIIKLEQHKAKLEQWFGDNLTLYQHDPDTIFKKSNNTFPVYKG